MIRILSNFLGSLHVGNGRVLAIIYGEDEAYTIWFLTGYHYKAEFSDGFMETGTYSVKDGKLELTDHNGDKRVLDEEWNMAFGTERKAAYVLADFSDSVRIIGEFNTDEQKVLRIEDENEETISLETIRQGIDNEYAFEILKAILPE